ncbi:Ima1 N-terminal domain-containing protein [Dipodascopsis uninucleata]
MAWLGLRFRSSSVHKRCFYCNRRSVVDVVTRSGTNLILWTCPLCQAVNTVDERGEVVDFVPEVNDVPVRTQPHSLENINDLNHDSPFCKDCQINHLIVTRAIAEYLPAEPDHIREASIETYKRDLERRYPPYCSICKEAVLTRLSQNNYSARARILGSKLSSRKGLSAHSFDRSRPRPLSIVSLVLWIIRGFLWITYLSSLYISFGFCFRYASSIQSELLHMLSLSTFEDIFQNMINEISSLRSRAQTGINLTDLLLPVVASFLRLHIQMAPAIVLFIYWDYCWLRAVLAHERCAVSGKHEYNILQTLVYAIIVFSAYVLNKHSSTADSVTFSRIGLVFSSILTILSLRSLTLLHVIPIGSSRALSGSDLRSEVWTSEIGDIQRSFKAAETTTFPGVYSGDFKEAKMLEIETTEEMDWRPAFNPEYDNKITQGDVQLPSIPPLPEGYRLPTVPIAGASLQPVRTTGSSARLSKSKQYFAHRLDGPNSRTGLYLHRENHAAEHSQLGPQRFFPNEQPTGLEDIFAPVLKLTDEPRTKDITSITTDASTNYKTGNVPIPNIDTKAYANNLPNHSHLDNNYAAWTAATCIGMSTVIFAYYVYSLAIQRLISETVPYENI